MRLAVRLLSDKQMDDSEIDKYWKTCSAVQEDLKSLVLSIFHPPGPGPAPFRNTAREGRNLTAGVRNKSSFAPDDVEYFTA